MTRKNDHTINHADDRTSVIFAVLNNVDSHLSTLDTINQVEDFEKNLCEELGCLSFAAKDRIRATREGALSEQA